MRVAILFVLVFSFLASNIATADDDPPVVVTNVGTIRGVRATDGNYSMFMGVPYGLVNVSNPFGVASPYPSFTEIYDADDDTVACPQIEEYNLTIIGVRDCLNLNIYVPDSASAQNPAAVLLYIFGGRFWFGYPSRYDFGPRFLVRHDVIVITINYRVGPYGFMCLNTPEVPCNQGLRDQFLSLQWVKNNIASFGGDPGRVTLFGSSAGAMSCDYHIWAETEKLFSGIIIQSGTAYVERWSSDEDTNKVLALSEALGLNTTNVDEAIAFLATFDPSIIIQTGFDLSITFSPRVEKYIEGIPRMIPGHVVNLDFPQIDQMNVMLGYTDDENMLEWALIPPEFYSEYKTIFREDMEQLFDFDNETLNTVEKMVRNFYVGDEDFTIALREDLANYRSDMSFVYSTERALARYIENDFAVYYYVFCYLGQRNFVKQRIYPIEVGGAYHADEVGYLFDVSYFPNPPTTEDQLIIDRLTLMWANFAKYGDPTPETSALLPVKWVPVTKGSVYHYLNISLDMSAGRRPFHQRMSFWDLFFQTYGKYERTVRDYSSGAERITPLMYFIVIVLINLCLLHINMIIA